MGHAAQQRGPDAGRAVEGGMVGALIGFGVDAGPAIVGVVSYRAFAFWLPMIPGAVAYLQLVRAPEQPAVAGAGSRPTTAR